MRNLELKENADYYYIVRQRYYRAHEKSLFTYDILPGIVVEFGENKSKLNSKQYHLTRIYFSKKIYKSKEIETFLRNYYVIYIKNKHNGKKLPPIYHVCGSPGKLIREGYLLIVKNTDSEREGKKQQLEYDFWKEQFYKNSMLSQNTSVLNQAIPILINRIEQKAHEIKDIPISDNRIFEELIAEIFNGFGYQVELTKQTRDGGKDIIALRNINNQKEKILIECKHWSNKVDVKPVRALIGVAVTEEEIPTGIILATSNEFTSDAEKIKINPSFKIELELKDYHDILKWIDDYSAIQFTSAGINNYFQSLIEFASV